MKKIFCDCCGKEFKYEDKARALFNKTNQIGVPGKVGSVLLDVRPMVDVANLRTGQHLDVCGDCLWRAIDLLDPRPRSLD